MVNHTSIVITVLNKYVLVCIGTSTHTNNRMNHIKSVPSFDACIQLMIVFEKCSVCQIFSDTEISGKSWAFSFTKFYKTFIAWEQGILNRTLLWGWWQDCMSQVMLFTVVKTECYVKWTMYVSLKQRNKWPLTIKEETFCNAEINQSAVWSVWGIRT